MGEFEPHFFWNSEMKFYDRSKERKYRIKEKEFKTFEQMALDELRKIQPATRKQWASRMGYDVPNAFYHTLKKLVKSKQVIELPTRPYAYVLNEAK